LNTTETRLESAWARRPANAVSRLAGRQLLVLSSRHLLTAAAEEDALLVAFIAPAPAAALGFARAARDTAAPLVLALPSGSADEKGPEEARDDTAFVESALQAAADERFYGPMALLKEPPRAGSAVPERDRIVREIETGYTGVALTARPESAPSARDAALAAAQVCQRELGLEVVPLGGSPALGLELVRQLASRGAPPSALRVEDEQGGLQAAATAAGIALSTTAEQSPAVLRERGFRQLVAAGPFLRALHRAAPRELLDRLHAWADEHGATLEQAAARHQRLLRDLPPKVQDRLEALCCFEAIELLERASARGTAARMADRVGKNAPKDEN
jgi:hypothetical protein